MSPARLALLITLLAVPWLHAQQPPAPAPSPKQASQAAPDSNQPITTIRVTSRVVVLDVVVTDGNGSPVKGLQPSDFTLTEDGVPQKFSSFGESQATAGNAAAPPASLPPNTFTVQPPLTEAGTKTVIVLDNLHYPSYPLVRGDIQAFMKTVAPGNPIAIIRLDWQGLHFVQTFTSDPQLLQQAVASNRMLPALPPLNVLAWTYCQLPYQGVANPYHRLARYLAGIPGRINLAWVTDEGMPDSFRGNELPDLTNLVRNLNGSTNVLRLSRVVPYVIKAGGAIGGILQPLDVPDIPIPKIIAQSQNPPIPDDCPVVPGAGGSLLGNQAMVDAATAAGGHAFFDGADKALAQIMALGSNYYTLSYVPSNPKWNGAYRKIAIAITGIPKTPAGELGWSAYGQPKVVYRSGYYARSKPDPISQSGSTVFGPETAASAAIDSVPGSASAAAPHIPSAMEAAMGFGTVAPDQVNFTIVVTPSPQIEAPTSGIAPAKGNFLTGPFSTAPYRNYKVHYWIDPKSLKFSRLANGAYRDDLQFAAILYRDDGFVANSSSVTTHIQVSADGLEDILSSGVTFDQTIALPVVGNPLPENFFLRTGIDEVSTGRVGALELPTEWIKLPPR